MECLCSTDVVWNAIPYSVRMPSRLGGIRSLRRPCYWSPASLWPLPWSSSLHMISTSIVFWMQLSVGFFCWYWLTQQLQQQLQLEKPGPSRIHTGSSKVWPCWHYLREYRVPGWIETTTPSPFQEIWLAQTHFWLPGRHLWELFTMPLVIRFKLTEAKFLENSMGLVLLNRERWLRAVVEGTRETCTWSLALLSHLTIQDVVGGAGH